ncbi:peptidase inhibitor family I36 protein [Streptomyces meridianus]|uniref:Peptidase inhibitor family I36 protein n=1 Tax=Streptomyces meridianus TaxID=2938945 RepID=A0ABT0X6A5_9ACTN|nr:peptidase inhibitor family I36 protein [Streptomyces meridianus]MCM2578061.1 peptidase inhibitor family I36 protein [Streptomyces meridianus]
MSRYRTFAASLAASAAAVVLAGAGPAGAAQRLGDCAAGQLCLWPEPEFRGSPRIHELHRTGTQECVALPRGSAGNAFANRTGRPVTVYQDPECGETGEFDTYPGDGTWVPRTAYQVRAVKFWEH